MSFYSANLRHPAVSNQFSGETTATDTQAPLTSEDQYAPNGVWIKNEDASEGVRISAPGIDGGFLLSPNTSRFFPVENANAIQIQRAGDVNVDVSYWAG